MLHLSRISDLDELVLTVRDQTSRSYIMEAIYAYRSGAYRASIISTWIATTYDIISKLRELAIQGESNAIQWARHLDNAIDSNNIRKLQDIEDDLLRTAFEDFKFLNAHEYEDLCRLKKDRNLCAHPAFISEETLFQPSPDLVRTHITHATTHLLSQLPVQGRSALERIKQDLLQASFPTNIEDISTFLNEKYLNRARETLTQSLIDVLTKTILRGDDPDFAGKERLLIKVLAAVSRRYPGIYETRMAAKLGNLSEHLDDDRILFLFLLLRLDVRCWRWIGNPSRIRLRGILIATPPKELPVLMNRFRIFDLFSVPELKPVLMDTFNEMDAISQQNIMSKYPRLEFAAKAIEIYSESGSFRQAESVGQSVIAPMAQCFSAEDVALILEKAQENRQIHDASGTKDVILKLFDQSISHFEQTKEAWKKFVGFMLRYNDPNGYYAYPELQERLKSKGITVEVPLSNPYLQIEYDENNEEEEF